MYMYAAQHLTKCAHQSVGISGQSREFPTTINCDNYLCGCQWISGKILAIPCYTLLTSWLCERITLIVFSQHMVGQLLQYFIQIWICVVMQECIFSGQSLNTGLIILHLLWNSYSRNFVHFEKWRAVYWLTLVCKRWFSCKHFWGYQFSWVTLSKRETGGVAACHHLVKLTYLHCLYIIRPFWG